MGGQKQLFLTSVLCTLLFQPRFVLAVIMSSDIAWAVTRNNSAFLLKKRNCPKPFSTDPLNLTNRNTQRYSGFLQRKAVGVTAADKGFVLSVKVPSKTNRPSKSVSNVQMKSGARSSLTKVRVPQLSSVFCTVQ